MENEAKSGSWSHAYLLVGNDSQAIDELIAFIKREKRISDVDLSVVRPPDETGRSGDIKVEEIRRLIHEVHLSPYGKERLAVVYGCDRLNQSSGNVLLKTLEEPPGSVTFVLAASCDSVLPTIKSRCRLLRVSSDGRPDEAYIDSLGLLTRDFATISKECDRLAKENEIEDYLDSLEQALRQLMLADGGVGCGLALKEVLKARKSIRGNANSRLVLENMALRIGLLVSKQLAGKRK